MTRQNHKRGFNLIEAAFVLAVVGGVIGTIWVSAANMYENHKVNKTVEGILTTARNIQNLISVSDSETIGNSFVLNTTLINAGAIPKDWLNGSNIKNPFDGNVNISNLVGIGFNFYIYGIGAANCVKIAVRVSSIGAVSGSHGAGAVGRSFLGYMKIGSWDTTTFPVSTETASNACNLSSNIMQFTFGYTRIN